MVRIIMGDPGSTADPFAIVGIELDLETGNIEVKMAKQFIKTEYGIVAQYFKKLQRTIKPHFMGIETNNRGKEVQKLFHEKYDVKVAGIHTSSHMSEKKRHEGKSMDKPFTVQWLKKYMGKGHIKFLSTNNKDMKELLTQIGLISSITTLSGGITYKAHSGRHDDLFMALLLCCHIARLYMENDIS